MYFDFKNLAPAHYFVPRTTTHLGSRLYGGGLYGERLYGGTLPAYGSTAEFFSKSRLYGGT